MSAYVVGRETIDTIVTAVIDVSFGHDSAEVQRVTADGLGRMFWEHNAAAVAYRYPSADNGQRPGPDVAGYHWRRHPATPREVVRACVTLDYQCDEAPDWATSPDRAILADVAQIAHEVEVAGPARCTWCEVAAEAHRLITTYGRFSPEAIVAIGAWRQITGHTVGCARLGVWDGLGGFQPLSEGTTVRCNQVGHTDQPHPVTDHCGVGAIATEAATS